MKLDNSKTCLTQTRFHGPCLANGLRTTQRHLSQSLPHASLTDNLRDGMKHSVLNLNTKVSSTPFTTVRTGVTKMTCSWMPKWHLINISSLKSVNIRDKFPVANERMDTVTTAKFLRVTIDCHLTFKSHVTERITKARKLVLFRWSWSALGFQIEDLIEIYRARILSLLTYATPAWFTHISQTLITNLERVQKFCLKIIV